MVLKFFKGNSLAIVLLMPLLAIVLWSDIFGTKVDHFVPIPFSMPAYALVMKWMPNLILSGLFALLLIILQAYYLLYINRVYNFISQRTYLTSILFILISSAFLNLHYLHPAIIANVFVLLTIVEIFSSYRKPKIFKAAFNSGFLIAIAGLFYINANFLLIFVFISLMVLHSFNWRAWTIVLIGFITPYLFTLFIYYFFDQLKNLQVILNAIVHFHSPKLIWPLSYYLFSGLLFMIGLLSIYKLSTIYSNNKISTRNYFSLFIILLLIITILFLIIPFASIELIVLSAIPLSYLIANYYLSKANKWIHEITFLLLLASYIFFYLQKYFEIGS